MKTKAYFIGGIADGMVREFEGLPPERMQASSDQLPLLASTPGEPAARMIYSRNDLTGGTVIYVPAGTLLHDAFVAVLDTYADLARLAREQNGGPPA